MRGSQLPHAQFSLQYLKFSLRYTMRNMFGMFSFAFWVISTQKCEADSFLKFESAGIPIRPFKYLSPPILLIACAPCTHMCDVHAHCDVTSFTYDVNHVSTMSLVFMFHSCHIGMRWHAIIGVHIVGTPCPYGLYQMGMTSA